jgi:hypothetical protein
MQYSKIANALRRQDLKKLINLHFLQYGGLRLHIRYQAWYAAKL